MLATLGTAPRGDGSAVEHKWDGQRCLAVIDGDAKLYSRNGMDISRTFPEVAAALPAAVGRHRRVVLDGELVVLDEDGWPCFQRLQRRWPHGPAWNAAGWCTGCR
jgi:bifunctional non-homologous end joining protein LigD